MVKHKFLVGVTKDGAVFGAQCVHCSQIALYVNGKVPEDIRNEYCGDEDFSQTAARVVRQATEK